MAIEGEPYLPREVGLFPLLISHIGKVVGFHSEGGESVSVELVLLFNGFEVDSENHHPIFLFLNSIIGTYCQIVVVARILLQPSLE